MLEERSLARHRPDKDRNPTPLQRRPKRLAAISAAPPEAPRGRREDPNCARWHARRDLNRRALPARRHRREHVLLLVKEFLEAGKRRLAGDTARAATTDEVKQLRREAQDLKEVVAEQALELRLLKKSMIGDGGDQT